MERLLNAYRSLNREVEGIALLRGYLGNYHSLDLMNVVFDGVLKMKGRLLLTNCAMSWSATDFAWTGQVAQRSCWKCRWKGAPISAGRSGP